MKLKELRKQKNLLQAELAEKAGVNYRMIQYYEQGVKDINIASALTLYKIATVLECKIEDLLELDKIEQKDS